MNKRFLIILFWYGNRNFIYLENFCASTYALCRRLLWNIGYFDYPRLYKKKFSVFNRSYS